MSEREQPIEEPGLPKRQSWLDRNPKLSILLIAGVFYLILIGMCATLALLLIWNYRA